VTHAHSNTACFAGCISSSVILISIGGGGSSSSGTHSLHSYIHQTLFDPRDLKRTAITAIVAQGIEH
jgi:hypothetical protein